jgi:hypothetical protein
MAAVLTKSERDVINVMGEMCWPAVGEEVAQTGWRLRYAPETITESDRLWLASLVDAWIQMVCDPIKKRNAVCREIKAAVMATGKYDR